MYRNNAGIVGHDKDEQKENKTNKGSNTDKGCNTIHIVAKMEIGRPLGQKKTTDGQKDRRNGGEGKRCGDETVKSCVRHSEAFAQQTLWLKMVIVMIQKCM